MKIDLTESRDIDHLWNSHMRNASILISATTALIAFCGGYVAYYSGGAFVIELIIGLTIPTALFLAKVRYVFAASLVIALSYSMGCLIAHHEWATSRGIEAFTRQNLLLSASFSLIIVLTGWFLATLCGAFLESWKKQP